MRPPRTATRTICPRCGATILQTPDGRHLDPTPHPLAVHLPDGGRIDALDAAEILTGRQNARAHHPHLPGPYGCTPPTPTQPTLF
ncbi:hypothetical protein [Kitasatospora sp. CB01950]|uniref:hypothetical protein n=1 Tax=Kitasatospora sp. CB01950 TaxID=1703930 RepID=UPI000939D822|nr:hypothetical protein [Kitasatospora sp. CB01950]OKJ06806.1 hypothetical protein AMK19_23410 [Kitasatospora sp. CB01950]